MRILFVADGRSPIALNWMEYFIDAGHEVHLASTYPYNQRLQFASVKMLNVAFSGSKTAGGAMMDRARGRILGSNLRTKIRQWLGPMTLVKPARDLRAIIASIKPDLVHSMRIPFESMVMAQVKPEMPWLISVWGNDFTLHAQVTPLMARFTRLALQRATALHTDCHRDIRLAHNWGFSTKKPTVVLPGGGGVQMELFHPIKDTFPEKLKNSDEYVKVYIINPRGFRAYVHNEAFFQATPEILSKYPQAVFLCPAMAGEDQAKRWVEQYNVSRSVELLPYQTRSEMATLFQKSTITVSPSIHDGTPNTLLEAMACGCFPIAGDLESIREWITPGINGLLIDPEDASMLSRAIIAALDQPELLQRARCYNVQLISERADYPVVMQKAETFYRQLI